MKFVNWIETILDLGSGWGPAVLEHEEELAFIRKQLKEMEYQSSYFIGGSTNDSSFDTLHYSNYKTTRSGYYIGFVRDI